MSNPETFRTKSSTISAGIVMLLIVGMNIQTWFSSSLRSDLVTFIWSTFVVSAIYLVMYRPKITIFDEGITITNPIKEYTIGWDSVNEVEARYSMSIITRDGREIFAWAAPAPGRYHARTLHPSEIRGMKLSEAIRPGESPRSDSGVARHLVVNRLEKFRHSEVVPVANETRIYLTGFSITAVSFVVGIVLHLIHF